MKGRFVLSLLLIFLATSVMAQTLPHNLLGNKHRDTDFSTAPTDGQVLKYTSSTGKWGPGSGTDSRIGTLTNTKWCYSDGDQILCTEDAPAGTGDITAVGSCASGSCAQIGNADTSAGYIDFLEDSDNGTNYVRLIGAASTADVTVTLPASTGTLMLTTGSPAAMVIASQAQGDLLYASSGTAWARLGAGTAGNPLISGGAAANPSWLSVVLAGGTNTFSVTNGTASLDVAAGATLNIDTSLQVATGAVVLNGNAGGSSSLTLGNFALSLGGTMADGRLCTYASSGTAISCNTATSTFQTADADLTTFAGLTATRGDILYVGEAGTWADLAKGSANTVLYSDGTDVKYGSVTSAMITDNTITATDLAATLTFADGDFVDLSGVTMSGTNDEGITLPFWADVTPTSGATKRFMTWDESGSVLKIYTASGWTTINPSAGAPTDVAYLVTGSLSGSLSAERLLAEGTGIDFTDAGANGNFTIAVDTTEIGTTTWGAGSEVVWTFNASGGTDPTITFGDATVTFAGTVSATAFSGNITGNVTGNCSGSAGTVTDTELAAIQGLTFADASIIQLTGAGAAAVLTSGGNNYVLKSTSDNSALEFAAPTGTGAPVLGTAPSFTTSITPNSAGASTIGTTSLEWGNVYLTDSAVIYGQADQSATLTSSASTWTASAFTVTGTLTANGNTVVGNADTDTLTLRSLIVGGNSRAVWIAGSAPTPTYATGTNELYVAGDIESGGNVYAANFVSTGTGESYIGMANNASRSPTASAYEIYFEGASDLKFNVNGAEKTTARLEDAQTFSGAKTFTGGLYAGDASNAASVRLYDGSSNYWTIAVPAMSGNYTLTLPADDGTTGQYLKTDGSGALSWDTPTAAAAGSDTQVQFNDGGSALGGDAGFVFAKTTGTLTLGKNTVGGELVLYNELGATDYNATIQPNAAQAAAATITLPAATGTLIAEGLSTGGIVLGDSTPDADGEIGYATNAYKLFANSEDLVLTASTNLWTFSSATSATVAFTPSVALNGGATVGETNGLLIGATGVKITSDNDGAITFTGNSAGYDEDLTINLDDTENTAVVSSSTGVTKLDFSALNLATTGIITGAMNTNSDANGMSASEMTTAGMYGTMFWATGAGTWALPGAATGMNFCVYSTTAAAVVINPDDGDTIVLNGTALSAGDSITSASGAGDFICLLAKDANTWYTLGRSGAWTDTN